MKALVWLTCYFRSYICAWTVSAPHQKTQNKRVAIEVNLSASKHKTLNIPLFACPHWIFTQQCPERLTLFSQLYLDCCAFFVSRQRSIKMLGSAERISRANKSGEQSEERNKCFIVVCGPPFHYIEFESQSNFVEGEGGESEFQRWRKKALTSLWLLEEKRMKKESTGWQKHMDRLRERQAGWVAER